MQALIGHSRNAETTMSKRRTLNRDAAKQHPDVAFANPLDLAAERLFTRGEKLATLGRWRQTIIEQLAASGEGMRTQGYSAQHARTLDLIEQAKKLLA
jgi:hypothetical protein